MGIVECRLHELKQCSKDTILAAEKIFFTKGISVAIVDDISEKAEHSKGIPYTYFTNKDDLIAVIIKRGMNILSKIMIKAVLKYTIVNILTVYEIVAFRKAYLDFVKKYPNHFAVMFEKELHEQVIVGSSVLL